MKMKTCEQQHTVLAALEDDAGPTSAAVIAHVAECARCRAMIGERVLGDRLRLALGRERAAAERDGRRLDDGRPMLEDEAALLLSGFGDPETVPDGISAVDRGRLVRAARALDEALPDEASIVERLGLNGAVADPSPGTSAQDGSTAGRSAPTQWKRPERRGLRERRRPSTEAPVEPADDGFTPSQPGSRRGLWAAGIVAAAAAALLVVGIGSMFGDLDWILASLGGPERLNIRGAIVDMELALGDRKCVGDHDPTGREFRDGEAEPCVWKRSVETFTMNVRIEPGAVTRYVAVFARDVNGELSLLYPDPGQVQTPLEPTVDRTAGCAKDFCWLEGGRYDVPAGPLSVVAVFSADPLPVDDMMKTWAPVRWEGDRRLIERFEVEVVR